MGAGKHFIMNIIIIFAINRTISSVVNNESDL